MELQKQVKLQLPSPISKKLGETLVPYFQIENELLTGHLKKNLTQWWLDLIEERVETFLKHLPPPFSYDALQQIPYNYLDTPPKCPLELLQQNLEIIRELCLVNTSNLSSISNNASSNPKESLRALIYSLCTEIYEKIDEFTKLSKWILHDKTASLVKEVKYQSKFDWNETLNYFEKVKNSGIDKTALKHFEELLADIQYIQQMKLLESHFENSQSTDDIPNQSSPSDIVPVTGLILGKLHRIENELKTVLQHWNSASRRNAVRK